VTATWSAHQVLQAARSDNEALASEREWYEARVAEHRADLAAIDARVTEAWAHLCSVLVPDLTPALLDGLARKLGLQAIGALTVAAGTRSEVARLAALRAEAAGAAMYQQREGIGNECDIRLAECDEQLAPLREVYRPIGQDPRYHRLEASAYGTSRYAGRWWSLSYYRDWKEGDELVEAFGPALRATDYPAMLAKIGEARAAARVLYAERDEWLARATQVQALVDQHDANSRRPGTSVPTPALTLEMGKPSVCGEGAEQSKPLIITESSGSAWFSARSRTCTCNFLGFKVEGHFAMRPRVPNSE